MSNRSVQEAREANDARLVSVVSSALGPRRRAAVIARCAPGLIGARGDEDVFTALALARLDPEGVALFWRVCAPVAVPNIIVEIDPRLSFGSSTRRYVLARSPHLRGSYDALVELLSRSLGAMEAYSESFDEIGCWEDMVRAVVPRLFVERLAIDPDFVRSIVSAEYKTPSFEYSYLDLVEDVIHGRSDRMRHSWLFEELERDPDAEDFASVLLEGTSWIAGDGSAHESSRGHRGHGEDEYPERVLCEALERAGRDDDERSAALDELSSKLPWFAELTANEPHLDVFTEATHAMSRLVADIEARRAFDPLPYVDVVLRVWKALTEHHGYDDATDESSRESVENSHDEEDVGCGLDEGRSMDTADGETELAVHDESHGSNEKTAESSRDDVPTRPRSSRIHVTSQREPKYEAAAQRFADSLLSAWHEQMTQAKDLDTEFTFVVNHYPESPFEPELVRERLRSRYDVIGRVTFVDDPETVRMLLTDWGRSEGALIGMSRSVEHDSALLLPVIEEITREPTRENMKRYAPLTSREFELATLMCSISKMCEPGEPLVDYLGDADFSGGAFGPDSYDGEETRDRVALEYLLYAGWCPSLHSTERGRLEPVAWVAQDPMAVLLRLISRSGRLLPQSIR